MSAGPDVTYYRDREQYERMMARQATSRSSRALHEELAARYRGLALAIEFNGSGTSYISDRDVPHIAMPVDR